LTDRLLVIGKTLGHYRVVELLGSGGMGEVYLAEDERLGRRVAVKVLSEALAADSSARRRFEREARVISSLSHPHICALYDLGEADGPGVGRPVSYLVMELVEGKTLGERLRQGSLALAEALRLAIQIAEALAAAHRKGVVHRDLKPSNVMLTTSGVKLLDFGLAKLRDPEPDPGVGETALPTASGPLTEKGTLLGTFPYMAPEQIEGTEADARTDIFAFGAVLFEMLTGKRAFSGSSRGSLIGAILHTEPPPLTELQPAAPAALGRVVRKCLAKDPEARWQSAQDLGDELRWIAEGGGEATPSEVAAPAHLLWQGLAWGLAAVLAAAFVLTATRGSVASGEPPSAIWASILPPDEVVQLGLPALSPDGRQLAFEGRSRDGRRGLLLRNLGVGEARPLPGTERGVQPFFSPDGRSLGFFSGGWLKTLDLTSGRILNLYDGAGWTAAGTWAGEGAGTILFSPGAELGLRRIAGSGGTAEEVTSLDPSRGESFHAWPHFLPDGRHFLFVMIAGDQPGIYLGALDRGELERLLPEPLIGGTAVAYAPSGHLLYLREATLMALPFDVDRLRVTGEPVRLAERIAFFGPGYSAFSISRQGTLVFREDSGLATSQPVWLDREGRELGTAGPPGPYWDPEWDVSPQLSPDGRRLAVNRRTAGRQSEIWILDLGRGTASPFVTAAPFDGKPVWSPAGDRLAWGRVTDIPPQVYVKPFEGAGEPERLTTGAPDVQRWPTAWSQSGRYILFDQNTGGPNGWDIYLLDLEAPGRPSRPLQATSALERFAAVSPDERLFAYLSTLTGRFELYLGTFPEPGRRWQVSKGGAFWNPHWSADGRELYYHEPGAGVMAVRVEHLGDDLALSEPELLFRLDIPGVLAVAPDGERFLSLRVVKEAPLKPFTLVLDWPQALR
jgi:eukaryotic-like serine/threonine-protein kinase